MKVLGPNGKSNFLVNCFQVDVLIISHMSGFVANQLSAFAAGKLSRFISSVAGGDDDTSGRQHARVG